MSNLETINTYLDIVKSQEQAFIKAHKKDYRNIVASLFLIKSLPGTQESISNSDRTIINFCTIAIERCDDLSRTIENREKLNQELSLDKYENQPAEIKDHITASITFFQTHYEDLAILLSLVLGIKGAVPLEHSNDSPQLMNYQLHTCAHFIEHLSTALRRLISDHKLLIETGDFDSVETTIKEVA